MYNIIMEFDFQTKAGDEVLGEMFIPFDGDVVYRPYRTVVLTGFLHYKDGEHKGDSAKNIREYKKRLINENCKKIFINDLYEITRPFIFENKGITSVIGVINGYNSNRHANAYFTNTKLCHLKIGEFFQNLKKANNPVGKTITFEEAEKINPEYFKKLMALATTNVKTSSSVAMEAK